MEHGEMVRLDILKRYFYLCYVIDTCHDKDDLLKAKIELEFITMNYDITEDDLKFYRNYKSRYKTLKKRILYMIGFVDCSFITLTFTDEVLNKTNSDTRKRYVKAFLKSISDMYIANVDFGAQNGREHYHAIVEGVNKRDFSMDKWIYGFYNCKCIYRGKNSGVKLTKYLMKLTNHAIKDTTTKKIIYSRDFTKKR